MKKVLSILLVFICSSSLYADLTRAQFWAISLTGIMTEANNSNHNTLHASSLDDRGRNTWHIVLSRDWGITSREELLATIESLESGGNAAAFAEIQDILFRIMLAPNENAQREILSSVSWDQTKINRFNYVYANWPQYYYITIKAWDLGRIISLCRWGYNVGFLSEDEAWELIFYYARMIQGMYGSWQEYGYDYFMGRIFWASGFRQEASYLERTEPIYERLLNRYWSWLEWDIDLDAEDDDEILSVNFLEPPDGNGIIQYLTNDPYMHNRFTWHIIDNPNHYPDIIEFRVNKISGYETFGFGMMFCVNDTDAETFSYYRLFITVNGRFAVAKRVGNVWATAPLTWRNSEYLNTGYNVYNDIRIERIHMETSVIVFRIFFNGNLAAAFTDTDPIYGERIAPVVSVARIEEELFPHIPVDVRWEY